MKTIKELPLHERPREKLLLSGAKSLSDVELLSVLLGKGSKKEDVQSLSKKLLKTIDERGLTFTAMDLSSLPGIGSAKSATIAAAFEFVRRRIKPDGLKIKFPSDILPLVQHYSDRKQEHFLCISVNGAREVINIRVISIGLVNKTQVHPREVFADVIAERASAVIVAHNHPNGDLKPSEEDIKVTKQLKDSASILGISFLDHIIFNAKGYYSFLEDDKLER